MLGYPCLLTSAWERQKRECCCLFCFQAGLGALALTRMSHHLEEECVYLLVAIGPGRGGHGWGFDQTFWWVLGSDFYVSPGGVPKL